MKRFCGCPCADTPPRLYAMVIILFLVISTAAHASSSVWVSNSYQMTDWVSHTYTSAFPELSSSYGPIMRDAGRVDFNGAWTQSIARADYGSLGAYAQRGNTTPGMGAYADASARFLDTWTISKDGLNGTQGYLNIWVDVDGSITGPIQHLGVAPGCSWNLRLLEDSYSDIGSWDGSGRQEYHGYMRQLSFIYGSPFQIGLTFTIAATHGYDLLSTNTVDYLNTVTLNLEQSLVLDGLGNPVAGYALTTESGHDYSAVPLPAALWLLGSGLAVLAGMKRRFLR